MKTKLRAVGVAHKKSFVCVSINLLFSIWTAVYLLRSTIMFRMQSVRNVKPFVLSDMELCGIVRVYTCSPSVHNIPHFWYDSGTPLHAWWRMDQKRMAGICEIERNGKKRSDPLRALNHNEFFINDDDWKHPTHARKRSFDRIVTSSSNFSFPFTHALKWVCVKRIPSAEKRLRN